MRSFLSLSLFCIFAVCCHKPVEQSLKHASRLMNRNLDSVDLIISNINENRLSFNNQSKFYNVKINYLLRKNAPFRAIDSLLHIHLAISKELDVNEQLEVLCFASYVCEVSGKLDSALFYSQKARELAMDNECLKESRPQTQRATAQLLQKNGQDDQALELLRATLTDTTLQYKDGAYTHYSDIAYHYKQLQEYDSAIYYLRKTIQCLDTSSMWFSAYHNELSEIYALKHNYKAALAEANTAISKRTRLLDVPTFNFAKAKVFYAIGQNDSARVYLMRTIQTPDAEVSTAAYAYLSDLELKENNWDKAYNAYMSYSDQLDNVGSAIKMEILKKQFQEEKMKNEIMQLNIKEQTNKLYLMILLMVLMALLLAFYFLYTRIQKKKALAERLHAEEQLKNIARLTQKECELAVLNEKAAELRSILFKKLSIAQKLPSPKEEDQEGGKKIILLDNDWKELIDTINLLYGGFITRLSERFPDLSKSDLEFCCLVKIKISLHDLSDIYCVSKAAITKRKTRLKNLKLDLHHSDVTLDEFIDSF